MASLAIGHGHPDARRYPLPYLAAEATRITNRENNRMATEAVLTQMAINAVFSKEGGKEFAKKTKEMGTG